MSADTTAHLEHVLESTDPKHIDNYFEEYRGKLVQNPKPFATYIREILNINGITHTELFQRTGFSEGYGYKILSEEKHTAQRDYILRICFASECTLKQTQRALKLYGMSELYAKFPRDAVLIIAFNQGIHAIPDVNRLLKEHGFDPLYLKSSPELSVC